MQRITRPIAAVLSSPRFGVATLCFFVFEAVWIACSALYPMAFDEDFHFGIIQFYSHHWLPFLSHQPAGTSQFGAIISDPSYLYHYLMSFPYRLINLFTHNQTVQVLVLRFMNIALFTSGLVLFYKMLRRLGSSRLLANTALALFALIPIVPLLAAHINYDNLLLPLTAWVCLLVLRINDDLRERKVNLKIFVILAAACILSCLVKYAFLPIALAVALFLGVQLWRAFRGHGARLCAALAQSHRTLGNRVKVGLLLLLLLSGGLFVQRYGFNLAAYHTPVPECDAVLSIDECMAYSPWARNYRFAQTKGDFDENEITFTREWVEGMYYRLFFMVSGPAQDYVNYAPMPLPGKTAAVIALASVVASIFYWRKIFRGHSVLLFLLLVATIYCAVLWLSGYKDFVATGQPVAINGRYLLLILFPLIAIGGRALAVALHRWPAARVWLAAAAIVLFLQGGGVLSFILRSNEQWDWRSPAVVHTNNAVRKVLAPVIIEGNGK